MSCPVGVDTLSTKRRGHEKGYIQFVTLIEHLIRYTCYTTLTANLD